MMKIYRLLLLLPLLWLSCSAAVEDIPLEVKVGRMIVVGLPDVELSKNSVIVEDITKRGIGGVILFESNVVKPEERRLPTAELQNIDFKGRLTKLCSEIQSLAKYPIIISIDQEGGAVNRLKPKYGFVATRTQQSLGEEDNELITRAQARATAVQLRQIGINTNFAPCVDININPTCPAIGLHGRSLSADEQVVCRHAQYMMEEHHKAGIITAIKHFPGHGSSLEDTHLGFTDVTGLWQPRELTPYRRLLSKESVGHNMVMVSHVFNRDIDSLYPATLSYNFITKLLRQELGWDGVVISDDMHMRAITDNYTDKDALTLCINAGCDMIILSSNLPSKKGEHVTESVINTIVEQVLSGAIPEERINEAYLRIVGLSVTTQGKRSPL